MALMYMSHIKSLKLEKNSEIWVWHILGCGWAIFMFYGYVAAHPIQTDIFLPYSKSMMAMKCNFIQI